MPSSLPSSVSAWSNTHRCLFLFRIAQRSNILSILWDATANLSRAKKKRYPTNRAINSLSRFFDLEKWFFLIPTNIKFPPPFAHFSARSISHSSIYVWWVPSIEKWDEQNGISFSLKWDSRNKEAKRNREIETSWKQFKSTMPAFLSILLPLAHRQRANLIIFQHEKAAKWWRGERKIRKSEQECDNNFSLACPVLRYRPHISHTGLSFCRSTKNSEGARTCLLNADKKAAIFKRN